MAKLTKETLVPVSVSVGVTMFVCSLFYNFATWKSAIDIRLALAETDIKEERSISEAKLTDIDNKLNNLNNFFNEKISKLHADVSQLKH